MKSYTQEDADLVLLMRQQGYKLREITEETSLTESTVKRILYTTKVSAIETTIADIKEELIKIKKQIKPKEVEYQDGYTPTKLGWSKQ